jgi:hypothetical protein
MPNSIVDGVIEDAVPGRRRGGFTVFKSIRFRLDDGSSSDVKKAIVKQPLADEIVAGARGRFYLFEAFDVRGVHGLRTPEGKSLYAFPTSNQTLFLIIGIINLFWIAFTLVVRNGVPLLGVALLVLAVVGWYYMNKGKVAAQRQFDGDTDYAGAVRTAPA